MCPSENHGSSARPLNRRVGRIGSRRWARGGSWNTLSIKPDNWPNLSSRMISGSVFSGKAALPFVAGIACSVAILCSEFFISKRRRSSSPEKVVAYEKPVIDTDAVEREDRISQLPDDVISLVTDAEEREDRISQLPDDVISLIISQLDTIEALKTSVLSRRWRHVYAFITEVRFSCCKVDKDQHHCHEMYEGEKLSQLQRKLVQGLDTFLQVHSGHKVISFELVCCFHGCFLENLRKWMSSVGRLRVEQLTLVFCPYLERLPPVFPSDFLNEALTVKRLFLVHCSFQSLDQNALTVLELDCIAFTSEQVESILLNCSSLQSLKFKCCTLPSKLLIHGPDLQLKSLTVFYCSSIEEIDLSDINLIDLQVCNKFMLELSFSCVRVQNFFLNFWCTTTPDVFGIVAKNLPDLKCMCLQTVAPCFEKNIRAGVTDNLSNLKQLTLVIKHNFHVDLLAVPTILDVCPFLQKFHLSMMKLSSFDGGQSKKREGRRHTQLKEVTYSGFGGEKNDYNFILYILKNVPYLERLTIFLRPIYYEVYEDRWMVGGQSNPSDDEKKQRIIIHEQLKCHAISKNIDITIV